MVKILGVTFDRLWHSTDTPLKSEWQLEIMSWYSSQVANGANEKETLSTMRLQSIYAHGLCATNCPSLQSEQNTAQTTIRPSPAAYQLLRHSRQVVGWGRKINVSSISRSSLFGFPVFRCCPSDLQVGSTLKIVRNPLFKWWYGRFFCYLEQLAMIDGVKRFWYVECHIIFGAVCSRLDATLSRCWVWSESWSIS